MEGERREARGGRREAEGVRRKELIAKSGTGETSGLWVQRRLNVCRLLDNFSPSEL